MRQFANEYVSRYSAVLSQFEAVLMPVAVVSSRFLGAIWGVILQYERVLQEIDLINPDCRAPISSREERVWKKAKKG